MPDHGRSSVLQLLMAAETTCLQTPSPTSDCAHLGASTDDVVDLDNVKQLPEAVPVSETELRPGRWRRPCWATAQQTSPQEGFSNPLMQILAAEVVDSHAAYSGGEHVPEAPPCPKAAKPGPQSSPVSI
ncbi:hypothetical protein CDD80_5314 [Ophiocordyceps camponoti-rufipedis]|uniref:Uncharacterized protein n=1 Tax=Ophiocordyceps camponoti-rufipedis TaxID=2004952 RepID=A0A2C5YUS0_9HYPO|nr:hypothetical protein CDD80_5314 [Ophiocordyceps camponoti-rufipedis]